MALRCVLQNRYSLSYGQLHSILSLRWANDLKPSQTFTKKALTVPRWRLPFQFRTDLETCITFFFKRSTWPMNPFSSRVGYHETHILEIEKKQRPTFICQQSLVSIGFPGVSLLIEVLFTQSEWVGCASHSRKATAVDVVASNLFSTMESSVYHVYTGPWSNTASTERCVVWGAWKWCYIRTLSHQNLLQIFVISEDWQN